MALQDTIIERKFKVTTRKMPFWDTFFASDYIAVTNKGKIGAVFVSVKIFVTLL